MITTSIEQSNKLIKLGIDPNTADMWYWEWPTAPKYNDYTHPMFHKGEDIRNIPAWSLSALLKLIAKKGVLVSLRNSPFNYEWRISYDIDDKWEQFHAENPIDAVIKMIESLVRIGVL